MKMKNKKKGQGAIELVVLLGGILFFFLVIFAIIQENILKKNEEKDFLVLQNVALSVREEINLASESSEGYFREFSIPLDILGRDYEISLVENLINISMGNKVFYYTVSNVTGVLKKGANNITKKNGKTYLN